MTVPVVLAAPDKFRGTASAAQVAGAVADAAAELGWACRRLPMADGGEGLIDVVGGTPHHATVTGPLGAPVDAAWTVTAAGVAVVEAARANGLQLAGGAAGNDPVAATSRGVGELVAAALTAGAARVLVGVGGSASTDGGLGAVQALRAAPGGAADLAGRVEVCCDVRTRFLDAARVFGPQKGADPAQVVVLGDRLARLRETWRRELGVDVAVPEGGGAAGGLAGGLLALGARLRPGFDAVAGLVGFDAALAAADVVVTGEGRHDATSAQGKVVGEVLARAARRGVPAVAVVGVAQRPWPGVVDLTARCGAARAHADPTGCVREVLPAVLAQLVRAAPRT